MFKSIPPSLFLLFYMFTLAKNGLLNSLFTSFYMSKIEKWHKILRFLEISYTFATEKIISSSKEWIYNYKISPLQLHFKVLEV